MSEKLKGVVKLSEERYWEMYNAGTLDPYKQYETPQEPTYSQAQIDKKLTKLEEQIESAGSSVDAYTKTETDVLLEDKADKDTTYTKTEVDDIKQDLQDQITTATGGEYSKVLVGGVYQPSFNADTKANASDIPTKTSDLTNDSGFITEEDIPAIPTKTSQLTNDSGFLTEVPSEYVTETELTNKSFAKQSDLDTTNSKVQENANAISDINSSLSSKADKAALDIVSNNVNTIQGKIPTQASATNQLADKEFVNSSISTATATFRGTVDSVASLPTTGVDINDYAFVRATDSAGNTLYQRYKYNGSQWAFEYELNNSSFTSDQWATINSGLTKAYVDNKNNEQDNIIADKASKSEIPTKVSQLDNDSGFISSYTETDPTVPDWAKAATKPSYAYSEITGTPTIPNSLSQLTSDSTHRTVTDAEKTTWNSKSNFSGNYEDLPDKPTYIINDGGDGAIGINAFQLAFEVDSQRLYKAFNSGGGSFNIGYQDGYNIANYKDIAKFSASGVDMFGTKSNPTYNGTDIALVSDMPSTDNLATKQELASTNANVSKNTTDIANLNTNKADKTSIPSIAGLASETYVNNAVADKTTTGYVDTKIAALVNSAPETLDTLGEVAKAIQDNETVVDALNSAIGNKADKSEIPDVSVYLPKTGGTITGKLELTSSDSLSSNDPAKGIHFTSGAYIVDSLVNGNYRLYIGGQHELFLAGGVDSGVFLKGGTLYPVYINQQYTNLGSVEKQWNTIYGKTIYQNGKQVANAEDIPDISNLVNQQSLAATNANVATNANAISALDTNKADKTQISALETSKADKTQIPDISPLANKDASNITASDWVSKLLTGAENFGDKIVEKLLEDNGYIVYASGLMIQWCNINANGEKQHTWLKPFSSATSYKIATCGLGASSNATTTIALRNQSYKKTAQGFYVYNSSFAANGCDYIAIGY